MSTNTFEKTVLNEIECTQQEEGCQVERIMAQMKLPAAERDLFGLSRHEQEVLAALSEVDNIWEDDELKQSSKPAVLPFRLLGFVVAAAAAIILAIVALQPTADVLFRGEGAFDLKVTRVRNGFTSELNHGDRVLAGDQVGFFYDADSAGQIMLLHVQGPDSINVLLPEGEGWHPVEAGKKRSLPVGLEFSDGSGCEWFVSIYGNESANRDKVMDTVKRMAEGADGCEPGGIQGVDGVEFDAFGIRR